MAQQFKTREEYLTRAAETLASGIILDAVNDLGYDYEVPNFRISVGFPPGSRAKNKALAVCFPRDVSTDGVNEIFVTPERDEPVEVLADVAHELIHAFDNCESGHRGFFAHVARHIGLVGKLTATTAGPELKAELEALVALQGDYPHHRMETSKIKKDGTRQLKVECSDCGCIFRTSRKWMDRVEHCPACTSPNITKS